MSDNSMHRYNAAPRCRSQVKADRTAVSVAGCNWLSRLPDARCPRGGAPKEKAYGQFRHGGRTKEAAQASRYINGLARLIRSSE